MGNQQQFCKWPLLLICTFFVLHFSGCIQNAPIPPATSMQDVTSIPSTDHPAYPKNTPFSDLISPTPSPKNESTQEFRLDAAATSTPKPPSTATVTPSASATFPAERGSFQIGVDSRIEILAIVQYLSDYQEQYQLLTNFDFDYKQEVTDYFAHFATHEAVTLFESMSSQGFSYDAPPALMIHLSPPPELALQHPLPADLIAKAGGEVQVDAFLNALRLFAREADFAIFFETHQPFYQGLANSVHIDQADLYILEDYYGMQQRSYNIVLVPLYLAGGFGPRVLYPDGSQDVYSISGPYGVKSGNLDFGSSDLVRQLAWHEFSHSFINALTQQHWHLIDQYEEAYEPIKAQMSQYGYGTWESCVNEHVVRAIVVRLIEQRYGKTMGQQALENEMNWGFIYTAKLVEELERYESNRDSYPTFADFYPELIAVFESYLNE